MSEREKWLAAAFAIRHLCQNREVFDWLILSRWLRTDVKLLSKGD